MAGLIVAMSQKSGYLTSFVCALDSAASSTTRFCVTPNKTAELQSLSNSRQIFPTRTNGLKSLVIGKFAGSGG
jgi:hypothetical protein